MQGNQVGFESSLQQHLDVEQRRAVLEAIGGSINPDSTLGEIIDAAEALGWSEKMGDLSLADLAEALLAPDGQPANAKPAAAEAEADADLDEDEDEGDDDEDEGDDDDDDDDDDFALEAPEPTPARRKTSKVASAKETKAAAAAAKKKASAKEAPAPAKRGAKKIVADEPLRTTKKTAKKAAAGKPGKKAAEAPAARPGRAAEKPAPVAVAKKGGKKLVKRKLADVDVDDRMSLDQAAEFFLPYVEELGEATMQALEENTGVSRRKLRFHVGQLVKHGYLERHGMGRGTYYTRC